ncbi:MAG: glutamate racemase [Eubacteriales bacterium]|nr:glutamate racemase [Eubacteriales bacterium]
MNPAQLPIGVFDSGLGGLTVLRAIHERLPFENTIYFGDSGRTPYGTKSKDTIIKYSLQIARFLLEKKVKMIVIACNTASSHAFDAVRNFAPVPVIEVITPGAQAGAAATFNQKIGIIGTKGTVSSGVYDQAVRAASSDTPQIIQQACPLFVGLAEEGWWDHPVSQAVADEYLLPLKNAGVDTLILGCTHYPLLVPVIERTMGTTVQLINAGSNVAARVESVLASQMLLNPGSETASHAYYTSDDARQFTELGSVFMDRPIHAAGCIDIERY